MAKGIVDADAITLDVVLAGLVGAITWNLITWYLGLPSSSSHALIGGMLGSAVMAAGLRLLLNWDGLQDKVLIPSLVAPFLGIVIAFALMLAITWIIAPALAEQGQPRLPPRAARLRRVRRVHARHERRAEDDGDHRARADRSGHLSPDFERPPTWVIVAAALAMAAGTYVGGWRIIKTLGHADRQDRPAAGVRGPDRVRGHPLGDGALRLPRLDDADDLGKRPRAPARSGLLGRALGRRRQHPRRLGADDPHGRARRSGHGSADAAAGGRRARRSCSPA